MRRSQPLTELHQACVDAVVAAAGNDLRLIVCDTLMISNGLAYPQRLQQLYDQLGAIIVRYRPQEAAIEELFFGKNVTTAIAVTQARGVTLLALIQNGLTITESERGQAGGDGIWGCAERTSRIYGVPITPPTCNPQAG